MKKKEDVCGVACGWKKEVREKRMIQIMAPKSHSQINSNNSKFKIICFGKVRKLYNIMRGGMFVIGNYMYFSRHDEVF